MLLFRRAGGSWHTPSDTRYSDEAALQALLHASPELLPGMSSRAVVVAREVEIADTGPVDLLAITLDGDIMLVECKLRANPEIRRHVVGQLFAYAAGLTQMTFADLDRTFDRSGGSLIRAARARAKELNLEWDEGRFLDVVSRRLSDGTFQLVIAVDEITAELRRIVEYLNRHTIPDVEVVAIELRYVRDGDVEILVPATYGTEIAAAKSSSSRRNWDEAALFAALSDRCSADAVEAFRSIYDWSSNHAHHWYWGDGNLPSVTAHFVVQPGADPVATWTCSARENGASTFDVNFSWIRRSATAQQLERLAEELSQIPALAPKLDGIAAAEFNKRPSVALEALSEWGTAARVIAALETLVAAQAAPD